MKKTTTHLKKTALLFLIVITSKMLFAALPSMTSQIGKASEKQDAKMILIPISGTTKTISLYELSQIDRVSLEILTGHKMNFIERLDFKLAQKKLQKSIGKDGHIQNEQLAKMLAKKISGKDRGFHLGGFALGFFFGLIGILISYVAFNNQDDGLKRNRTKWAWIGFGTFLVLYVGLIIAVLSNGLV